MEKREELKEPRTYAAGVPVYCTYDKIVPIGELKPNPKNPNRHPPEQIKALGGIIRGNGWRNNITVSTRSGLIVKGHGRLLAAQLEELAELPVEYQSYKSEADELADMTADNRLAELAETDDAALATALGEIDAAGLDLALSGYTEDEYREIAGALSAAVEDEENEAEDLDIEIEPPKMPITNYGDIWILDGRHRVMCGNSTNSEERAALLNGGHPMIMLTDPPYCSGGSKESDKSTGSIGTVRADGSQPMIANDILSTRGYQNLIAGALADIPCRFAYIFTDWRMWIYLFDLAEGAGFGVKSMIVWNKKTPGMGIGWRSQHELVLFGARAKTRFDGHKGYGNVIELSRSGNEFHPTQKPEELIETILDNMEWAEGVYDPFGGSGTTLIAAEAKDQPCWIMEIAPEYVDVIVKRYIRATGSRNVKCIRNGRQLKLAEISGIFDEAAESDKGGEKD